MKGTLSIVIILTFSLLVIPLFAISGKESTAVLTGAAQDGIAYEKDENATSFEKIRVLSGESVTEYSVDDYIFGVVAAEMPALYHEEALKAQAVAAYTFACYKINTEQNDGFDISDNPETAQAFITREKAREKWGDKADEYTKKIDDCISAVRGQLLSFQGEPIFAAYHAMSSGSTNSCADVWGKDLPYLQSCDSFGDKLANGYLSEASFTAAELAERLNSIAIATGEAQNYFKDIKTNNGGYVISISYCGKEVSGAQISELLGLRSSCFEISFTEGSFIFNVKGYGHGVGLSQTGADYMAKQGSTYEEILAHYYKGAVLQKN